MVTCFEKYVSDMRNNTDMLFKMNNMLKSKNKQHDPLLKIQDLLKCLEFCHFHDTFILFSK